MFKNKSVEESITELVLKVKALPLTEFSYYIYLLLACIKNQKNKGCYQSLVNKTECLIDSLNTLLSKENLSAADKPHELNNVINSLKELTNVAKSYRSYKITKLISSILGAIIAISLGLLLSAIGTLVGGIYGLRMPAFFKDKTLQNIGIGFTTGLYIGLVFGYRALSKFFAKKFAHKIFFCIKNIKRLTNQLSKYESHEHYKKLTKKYILDTFFANVIINKSDHEKDKVFDCFLKSKQQFQVCAITVGHLAKSLKGYLGHHVLIRFHINGVQDIPIEVGERKRTPNFVDQFEEPRQVMGETLFNMLVQDRILQETHKDLKNIIKIYDMGSDDCRTYVDKILISAGQEPTKIKRFSKETDKWLASKLFSPMLLLYSTIHENELYSLLEFPDSEILKVKKNIWLKKS